MPKKLTPSRCNAADRKPFSKISLGTLRQKRNYCESRKLPFVKHARRIMLAIRMPEMVVLLPYLTDLTDRVDWSASWWQVRDETLRSIIEARSPVENLPRFLQ